MTKTPPDGGARSEHLPKTMKTLDHIYDDFALTYEQNRGLFDMSEVLNDFYGALTLKTGRLLDLGCGAGEPFARFFLDHGWQVTGVDFSMKMLDLATRYTPAMRCICEDMRDVSFEPQQFDAITSIYSLFHVPRKDHPALFEKSRRWLKPGGKFLFTYATRDYTGQDAFEGYMEFLGEKLFYSHKSPDELYADLRSAGLTLDSAINRQIGGETFLWVTAGKDG